MGVEKSFKQLLKGYQKFRSKYHNSDPSTMTLLSDHGQQPEVMVVSCCDSRVDPAIILQCSPGELFVVRNVGNIIPPFEKDEKHHGTSAALEFGICYLGVKHLIILGHSQCGGLHAYLNQEQLHQNDFITKWVSITNLTPEEKQDSDKFAKHSLNRSYENCMTFPWIKERLENNALSIHQWFFNIRDAQLFSYDDRKKDFITVDAIV